MAHHNFEKGDIVRLKTGTAPIVVTAVGGDAIKGRYHPGGEYPFTWRKADHFEKWQEPITMANQLFALKSDPSIMGFVRGTNSSGSRILEIRPSGELKIVEKDDLEEVRPYTIGTNDGQHYECKPGLVEINDVLVIHGDLTVVTALDTKSRSAKPMPKARRVSTTSLTLDHAA